MQSYDARRFCGKRSVPPISGRIQNRGVASWAQCVQVAQQRRPLDRSEAGCSAQTLFNRKSATS